MPHFFYFLWCAKEKIKSCCQRRFGAECVEVFHRISGMFVGHRERNGDREENAATWGRGGGGEVKDVERKRLSSDLQQSLNKWGSAHLLPGRYLGQDQTIWLIHSRRTVTPGPSLCFHVLSWASSSTSAAALILDFKMCVTVNSQKRKSLYPNNNQHSNVGWVQNKLPVIWELTWYLSSALITSRQQQQPCYAAALFKAAQLFSSFHFFHVKQSRYVFLQSFTLKAELKMEGLRYSHTCEIRESCERICIFASPGVQHQQQFYLGRRRANPEFCASVTLKTFKLLWKVKLYESGLYMNQLKMLLLKASRRKL